MTNKRISKFSTYIGFDRQIIYSSKRDTTPRIFIRYAGYRDIDQIVNITGAIPEFRVSENEDFYGKAEMKSWVKDPRTIFLVVEEMNRKQIIGYTFGMIISKQWFMFDTLFVHPDFRGRGIGTALFHELERILKSKGVQYIQGFILNNRKESLQYWKNKGFEVGRKCVWVHKWLTEFDPMD